MHLCNFIGLYLFLFCSIAVHLIIWCYHDRKNLVHSTWLIPILTTTIFTSIENFPLASACMISKILHHSFPLSLKLQYDFLCPCILHIMHQYIIGYYLSCQDWQSKKVLVYLVSTSLSTLVSSSHWCLAFHSCIYIHSCSLYI